MISTAKLETGAPDGSCLPKDPASAGFQPGAVFIQGAGAIGLAMAMQRGLGFVATILAARSAGPAAFGAYSTALATAGMLAGYMGLGIGNSASRYIGRFPRDTHAYRKTLRAITSIAILCAILAGFGLFAGAEPIAALVFQNENFSAIVQTTAIVVMALIFYEALNGILLGLLNFQHLFWLSSVSGVAMVVALVSASPYGSEAMIVGHGAALAIGMVVAICCTRGLLRPLPPAISNEQSVHPREILLFGITQVGSGAGIALASWWVAVLVTWSDFSLEAMGYYGVGNQLRAMATMMPSLISQMVLPLLGRTGNSPREQEEVVRTSTFFCVASGFAFGGLMLLVLPFILALYGQKYEQATGAAALLIATAVVHIGGAPQAHALTVLSLRATALVNLAWTISLSLLAWFLVPAHGAAGAAGAWLLSHLGSQVLVHSLLRRKRRLPWGVARVWWLGTAAVLALSALACAKASMDGSQVALDSAQAILLIGTAAAFVRIGQREGFVPREMKSLILGLASIASTAFDIFGRTERKKIS